MENSKFKIFKLKNGVEVILIPKKDSPATTVMSTVMVGSKYETKDISGLSHFLEHMAFKGTQKRPKAIDISTELEGLGASYNATTGQERTNYYAKVMNKHFDKALDIVSDLYLNPTVSMEELEKERGVILEEINMYEDMPMRNVYDLFLKTMYGDQPAGWSVAGRKEVVKSLKREDFLNFRKEHYNSENTIITISGGYEESGIEEKLESFFGSMPKKSETIMPEVNNNQNSPNEKITFKDSDQAHLIIGFRAFPVNDKRRSSLAVLSGVLGKGMSSRLFTEVREKRGLAYYVGSWTNLLTNNGFMAARAGVNKEKVDESIEVILNEFTKLKKDLVKDDELKKAKESMIGSMFLALETSDDLADFYTEQRVERLKPETPEEIAKRIYDVTAENIRSVANDIFINEGLNLSVIGPFKDKSFGDILKV